MPIPPPASESCRTAAEGDECYQRVLWAMETGLVYPEWFSPLTKLSCFEDFQRHLHGAVWLTDVCPKPCTTRPPVSGSCRTSVEGDECYKRVQWAMQTDVVKYPERVGPILFSPLIKNSSFKDF